jgi:hypothetical protein
MFCFKQRIVSLLALWMIAVLALSATASAADTGNPAGGYKLLIYYGIPEGVNGTRDPDNPDKAAAVFAGYDHVVFGEGLEDPDEAYHNSTAAIIRKARELSPDVRFYGYVDLDYTKAKYSMTELKRRTDLWHETGADGIFLDDAGYDYGGTRIRFNEIVRYIHSNGMSAFVNAWNPADVISSAYDATHNSKSLQTAMDSRDIYLLEDFLLPTDITKKNSPSAFSSGFRAKLDKALYYRKLLGIRLMSVSTIEYQKVSADGLRKFFRMNEAAAGVFSLDGYGVAPVHFASEKPYQDLVHSFPYSDNYMSFYNRDVVYTAKYGNQDFARAGFRLHSLKGSHYYNFPKNLVQKN